jgi:hypothetical protein
MHELCDVHPYHDLYKAYNIIICFISQSNQSFQNYLNFTKCQFKVSNGNNTNTRFLNHQPDKCLNTRFCWKFWIMSILHEIWNWKNFNERLLGLILTLSHLKQNIFLDKLVLHWKITTLLIHTALSDSTSSCQISVFPVHVVCATSWHIPQPDTNVLDLQGLLLVYLKQNLTFLTNVCNLVQGKLINSHRFLNTLFRISKLLYLEL